MTRFSLLTLLVAASSVAATTPPKTRLAEVQSIRPTGYRAELTLDPTKNKFSGVLTIRMNVEKATDTVWLNQEQISIERATVKQGGKEMTSTLIPGGDDFVGLHFAAPLATGALEATIRYTGIVVEKNSTAVFRQQESGNWYLFTQFEPTDARGAFPCFDEPSYKTPWQLTLHIPAGDSAISNTGIASQSRDANGMQTVVFRETKPLPSYLVAFGVGPFEYVNAGVAGRNKVPVRIVVPKGRAGEAGYAAEVTATLISRLEDYFGIPYPYDKADQVAVPDTAGWGAMENPGMVTYQQNIIIADPRTDRVSRQRDYAEFAAHELAHQWFGDLVTTNWWDDIWLNEAFATWMASKVIAEWKPEWNTRAEDVTAKLGAEADDSLLSARRIREPILGKDEINNAFDSITYQKGAAVIGMFEAWMGADAFRKGVNAYLNHYAWRATTAGDFLDSLSSSWRRDVGTAFGTFLNQAGAPMVTVNLNCKGTKPALTVSQKRFVPLGSKASGPAMAQTWRIPFCFRYGSGTTGTRQCVLIEKPEETVALDAANSCPAWVQADDAAMGYYHVAYGPGMVDALTTGDVQKRLTPAERADLMGNVQSLTRAGAAPAADALALVERFHDDPERNVFGLALDTALGLRRTLVAENLIPNYQRFLQKTFGPKAHALGWAAKPGEDIETTLERPDLLRAVATIGGDKELESEVKALADRWFADHTAVDGNLRGAVLSAAAYNGDKNFFDRLLATFKATQDKQERGSLVLAMEWMRDPAANQAGLEAILRGDIPFIEGSRLFVGPQKDGAAQRVVFDFMRRHFDEVVASMPGGGGFDYGAVLPQVGGGFCDAASRDDLRTFFAPKVKDFIGATRTLDQTVEAIDLCIARRNAQQASVAQFLGKY